MSKTAVAYADMNGKIVIRAEPRANFSLGLPLVRGERNDVSEAVTALAEYDQERDVLIVPGARQSGVDTTEAILEFSEQLIERVECSSSDISKETA